MPTQAFLWTLEECDEVFNKFIPSNMEYENASIKIKN
jgi:hypothetical protein